MNEWPKERKPNSLKSEHLREGVRPIMACVGSPEAYGEDLRILRKQFVEDKKSVDSVNFFGNALWQKVKGYRNAGKETYIISPINNHDKSSLDFFNCTGLVATGVDKDTSENVSFASHQDPEMLLVFKTEKFVRDFEKQLQALKERCTEGTIDVVIVGGNLSDFEGKQVDPSIYADSIELLSDKVEGVFGFKPVIIQGPKVAGGGDDMYYDNTNRRLYLLRRSTSSDAGDFTYEENTTPNLWDRYKATTD